MGEGARSLHKSGAPGSVEYDVTLLAQGSKFFAVRSCSRY